MRLILVVHKVVCFQQENSLFISSTDLKDVCLTELDNKIINEGISK